MLYARDFSRFRLPQQNRSCREADGDVALVGFLTPAFALDPTPSTAPAPAAKGATVTVFAAASLKNALDDAAALWKVRTGEDVAISYAASFTLARQIEAGRRPISSSARIRRAWIISLARA